MAEHSELPWWLTANSWQYTTIYDVNGNTVCRLDLEDWGVTEENQDDLEKRQAQVAAQIVLAANHHHKLVEALEFIRDGYERTDINHVDYRVGAYKAALDALAALKEASDVK